MMVRGYKSIAAIIEKEWSVPVSAPSVMRWTKDKLDPLPVRKIKATAGSRSIITADSNAVKRWALGRVR